MSSIGSGQPWLRRQRRDLYVRRAKEESWRSRAVYKLIEMDQAHRLVHRRDTVIDLGAAPGSWSQYLARRAATVVACDLKKIEPIDGVKFVCGDFTDLVVQDEISCLATQKADVLVSDCSPAHTGVSEADQGAMTHLAMETIALASRLLRCDGVIVMKILQGAQTQELWRQCRSECASARVVKPAASRAQSREVYWLLRPSVATPPQS
ncbi:MAG: RlmE family RNA methyltransferase [Gammaproteobacteria bacterium]|nr:RlmE family RNA methyltransferase [Pseudomonadota bacterium]MCH9662926.1 RlmE family RNA methyltransferase [Gammaproteobacteria bacterium]